MHFIERIFGTAPDGGNGLFELASFIILAFTLGIPLLRKLAGAVARFVGL